MLYIGMDILSLLPGNDSITKIHLRLLQVATLIEPTYLDVSGTIHHLAVEPFLSGTIGNRRACYLRTGFKDEPDSFDGCLLAPDIVQI